MIIVGICGASGSGKSTLAKEIEDSLTCTSAIIGLDCYYRDHSDLPFEERRIVSHSAGSIEGAESDELVEALFAHPDFAPMAAAAGMTVLPGHSFRHLAVQEKADIHGIVLAPPHDHLGEAAGPLLPRGCAVAGVPMASSVAVSVA